MPQQRLECRGDVAIGVLICKTAGIQVLYCQEQFENGGSFLSAIMKNFKRVAAGDYSRELSEKVFLGSCRMVRRGFKKEVRLPPDRLT